MKIIQSFKLALKSIMGNKMRSILTMLGLIIGVAAVIIIMGLMNGVTKQVSDSFSDMGVNSITCFVGQNGNRVVTEEDMQQFASDNKDIVKAYSPCMHSQLPIKTEKIKRTTTIYGVNETYQEIKSLKVQKGRFLNYADSRLRLNNCVLGAFVAKKLFPGEDCVGQTVKINGQFYTVVGKIKAISGGTKGSMDDVVYISYASMMKLTMSKFVDDYEMMAVEPTQSEEVVAKITKMCKQILGSEDYFYAYSAASMVQQMSSTMAMLTAALSGIAAISLLVAGIGIMNIMLVSVTERTQEIGIRKSLGAKKRDILSQFLIEAAVESGMGGILGIFAGAGILAAIGKAMKMTVHPTLLSILISFGVSVTIGVLFGIMPARKAAKLNPIDALRGE